MKPVQVIFALAVSACLAAPIEASELLPPVKLTAGGQPIDVQREAHSAPFVGDFDGDGSDDLLVGEYHEGRLRIFKNMGTNEKPEFAESAWFMAGKDLGRVPSD